MKVLAINSSARTGGGSKTELLLNELVEGMRSAGAEVDVVNLKDKKVKHCVGCFTCWTKTPGVCVHQDDMTKELFPAWCEADLVVYATPLYHFTVNARLKVFIERTLPMLEPFMVRQGEHTTHPLRIKPPATVMLSVAGFPNQSVFGELSHWTRFLFNKGLLAEIYRAGAESLTTNAFVREKKAVLAAVRQAGVELVQDKAVKPETMEAITRDYADLDDIADMANIFWRTAIEAGVTPREFEKQGLMPLARDTGELATILRHGFNPDNAGDMSAVIQFDLSGDGGGQFWMQVADEKLTTGEGQAQEADLTITSDFDLWMEVMSGKKEGAEVFMSGQARANGDLSLLMRFQSLFKG